MPTPAAVMRPALSEPGRLVLVADDDPAHRALMREILEPLGFTVAEAPDGPACLALAKAREPALVLLDIAMPGMSGWEVARTLRETGFTARIAMMSANVHEISPSRGADAPHDDIIAKPFDMQDLLERITGLLGTARPLPGPAPEPRPIMRTERPAEAMRGEAARGGAVPAEHVAALLRLGRIGHVRGIEAKLTELETDATVPPAFIAQMRGLVTAYDMRRYVGVLEGLARDA